MNTSAPMSLSSLTTRSAEPLTAAQLGYLEAYVQDRAHETVLQIFGELSEEDSEMTRAFLAKKLGKGPEQITRWLAVPGNWTLRTLAALLGAMGYVPQISAVPLTDLPRSNQYHRDIRVDFPRPAGTTTRTPPPTMEYRPSP